MGERISLAICGDQPWRVFWRPSFFEKKPSFGCWVIFLELPEHSCPFGIRFPVVL
jgi:hypothetical protein